MKVRVKLHSLLRLKFDTGELEVILPPEEATVMGLIEKLSEQIGPGLKEELLNGGEIGPGTIVLVNGRNILHLEGLETPLGEGDLVVFFPPGAGG